MNLAISTVEIAILIVLPLVVFFNRSGMPAPKRVAWIILFYLIWYLTYSLFHEFCHYAAAKVMGLEVQDFKFLPAFWKGEFAGGFIRTVYENSFQEFVVVLTPYVRDVLLVGCGLALIRWKLVRRTVSMALVILLLVLSSFYDVLDNFFAYWRGNWNDYWGMSHYVSRIYVHVIGATLTFLCFLGGLVALREVFKHVAGTHTDRPAMRD